MPEAKKQSTAWQDDPKTATRKWRTLENNFVSLKVKGDTVEGKLLEKGEQMFRRPDGEMYPVGRYQLQDDAGLVRTFLGSAQLDTLLISVEIGQYLKIVCTGTEKTSSGYNVKTYKVEVAD